MGCGASRGGRRSSRVAVHDDESGAYSTEMLKRYNHKHRVYELQDRDRELAQEIIALRRHTATERQRLVVRITEAKDLAAAATEQLRGEVHNQLGDFHGHEFAEMKWEVSASASHVSHLGARLQDCREQRQIDQQQTANAIAHLQRDFTAQVAKLTARVEAAERFALAAEAAQRRAEADAEARAADAAERAREAEDQRAVCAAECAAFAEQVETAVSEKLRAVETADLLFGMAEARATAAEAAQRRTETELAEAIARTTEATEIRTMAMKELHERVVESNVATGRTQEAARAAGSGVLGEMRLKARLEVAQELRLRAEDVAREEKTRRQKAEANTLQWAYRVAALEGKEVVRELGVVLPELVNAAETTALHDGSSMEQKQREPVDRDDQQASQLVVRKMPNENNSPRDIDTNNQT